MPIFGNRPPGRPQGENKWEFKGNNNGLKQFKGNNNGLKRPLHMGPSGPYGTLKTEYLQEIAKKRQNRQKNRIHFCASTIYFIQFG